MKNIVCIRLLLLLLITTVLSACSSWSSSSLFHDRADDYLQAKAAKPLVVPDDFDSYPLQDALVIPNSEKIEIKQQKNFSVPIPNQLVAQTDDPSYHIATVNNQRIIVARTSPQQAWQKLLAFWRQDKKMLAKSDKAQGIMVTQWFQAQGATDTIGRTITKVTGLGMTPMQGSYRTQIELDTATNTTHISLQYTSIPIVDSDKTKVPSWGKETQKQRAKANVKLNAILLYLDKQDRIQLQSGTNYIGETDGKTDLLKDGNGNPILQINLPFEQAWVAVKEALQNANIKINDLDRASELFYLAVDDKGQPVELKKKQGFLDQLFGTSNASDQKNMKEQVYQLRITKVNANQVQISLEKNVDTVAPANLSQYILGDIQQHLPNTCSSGEKCR